ncbi:type IV secretory system conjugative DNA transfer family protein [Luteibacter yeojuensis]|uniref:Type IV secretory system conjugative DNA transfer family protein n=1 Tax=Luteibacter yeojuensis TaxID=345309 RepID=A0A7X5QVM2_9GAMM|nr:type IV secretory system conjugative DNA transfer family protein [Luteibacter yeojuensis]NID16252.1 type IV secretory system conjugative DNA transfer family protein [Luteibacter yeojuensis]
MHAWKAVGAVIATSAALAGAAYGSGYLIYLLLGIDAPVEWHTAWRYMQVIDEPPYQPYAWRIKLGIGLGCGLSFLAWCAVMWPLAKSLFGPSADNASTHGDARFATLADIEKAGLLKRTDESILIGKFQGHELWLNGAQHVINISPTRSGKTASVAKPAGLTYAQSMVMLDVKGELYEATSGYREAEGDLIRVWAPYNEKGETHRFNPMTVLDGMDPGKRIGEIQTIAAILYPDAPGQDPFWSSQSRAAFTAFTSYMFEAWDHDLAAAQGPKPNSNASDRFPSFERILRLSSGERQGGTKALLYSVLKDTSMTFVSVQTRTVFANLAGLAEQTFSSVIACMQAPLQQFLSPILAAATNATDIDVKSLRRRLTTLFVNIPTNKLDESSKLLNIFFSTVIGNNLDKQLVEEPGLKYQVLMLMDEFTAMGRVDVWAKRISIAASYGVRDLCIIQSRAQLNGTYGENDAQNFITNHGAQIVFAPREQADANTYSEMLGYRTVLKQQRSTSRGQGGTQVSTSYVEERRALLLPQEVKELPADDELIFLEGCKPIRAQKNWFFKDKVLQQRANMPPACIVRDPEPDVVQASYAVQKSKSGPMRAALAEGTRQEVVA